MNNQRKQQHKERDRQVQHPWKWPRPSLAVTRIAEAISNEVAGVGLHPPEGPRHDFEIPSANPSRRGRPRREKVRGECRSDVAAARNTDEILHVFQLVLLSEPPQNSRLEGRSANATPGKGK